MSALKVAIHPVWDFDIDIPGVEVIRWDLKDPAPEGLDILVTGHWMSPNGVELAQRTGAHLLQIGSIGFDSLNPDLPEGLQVANAATVHETATSEMVVGILIALYRQIPTMVRNTEHRRWDNFYTSGLADRKIMLIGVGGVGRAIAQRLEPFEVELTYVASRERDEEYGHVFALSQIDALLPQQDAVVVVIPATDSTRGMIDRDFLSQMKDGAVFLNAGRGTLADTQALAEAGHRLQIAVDVADPEPLPPDSPLWDTAQLITSHNGGNTLGMHRRMKVLVERQIKHALAGEPFENIVLGKK